MLHYNEEESKIVSNYDEDILEAYMTNRKITSSNVNYDHFIASYVGKFDSYESFLIYILEEINGIALPNWLKIDSIKSWNALSNNFSATEDYFFRIN